MQASKYFTSIRMHQPASILYMEPIAGVLIAVSVLDRLSDEPKELCLSFCLPHGRQEANIGG